MGHARGAALITVLVLIAAGAATACGGPVAAPPEPKGLGLPAAAPAVNTARACGASGGTPLCVSLPVTGPDDAVRGDVAVTVTADSSFDQLDFAWGPTPDRTTPVFTDFAAPWQFRWSTGDLPDGAGYLVVRGAPAATGLGQPVALRLTIQNGDGGNTTTAAARDWADRFRPRPLAPGADPVIAAVGDGGDGTPRSDAVAASIGRSPANVLLYLGDIYEKGTVAEWENNFGTSLWSDPGGGGIAWGRLAGFTQPVLGNHEAHYQAAWRSYWRGRPTSSTFVYGGVRFLLLNSECGQSNGPRTCGPGSPQYDFAARVLAANTYRCVVAVWHRPVLSPGPEAPAMRPLWRLVASHGGDLVLNGHQHHMQAYWPLNGSLRAGQPDSHLVELVAGSGGHIMHRDVSTDPRSRWQAMGVPGALFITAHGGRGGHATRMTYAFTDIHHRVVRADARAGAGSVTC